MRYLVLTFAVIAGAINVALVARYGFVSSDTELDGAIVAFLFGVVAVGGLTGYAVAVHLWQRNRGWSIIAGLLALAALALNLSNSFEAILERGGKVQAERIAAADTIKDNRDALERIKRGLDGATSHVPTSAAAVQAAKAAADAATANRQAECSSKRGGRGTRCRAREADEAAALAAVAEAERNRAATARVEGLKAELATVRARLAKAGAPESASPLASGLARLFQIPETAAVTAATWQKFAIAAVVELLIACAFVSWELLHRAPMGLRKSAGLLAAQAERSNVVSLAERGKKVIDPKPIIEFLTARLVMSPGDRAEWGEVYGAYRHECAAANKPRLTGAEFGAVLRLICEQAELPVETEGAHVFLVDRKLANRVSHAPQRRLGHMTTVGTA